MIPTPKISARSALVALLLPLPFVVCGTTTPALMAGCKPEPCGSCSWKDGSTCRPCTELPIIIDNAPAVEMHPECCNCEANFVAQDRGMEVWECDHDSDGVAFTDTEGVNTGGGEGSTAGVIPTTGDPDTCSGFSEYECRGYVLGVYDNGSDPKRWKNVPGSAQAENRVCFDWTMTLDAGEEVLSACAADMGLADARAQCKAKCESEDWSFPASYGDWAFDGNFCVVEVAAPGGVVPGECNCSSTGGGTVVCENLDAPAQQIAMGWRLRR